MVVFTPSLAGPRKELSMMPAFEAGRSAMQEMLVNATVKAFQIQNILAHTDISVSKSLIRFNKKLAFLLLTTALLVAGCGPQITAADLAKYQGSFTGAESDAMTSGEYSHQFYYESVVPRMEADALARQIPQEDINLALATPRETKVLVGGNTTCSTGSIEKNEGGSKTGTPFTLRVNEPVDGTCHIEVVGYECVAGTNTCTMPATFSVNVTTDKGKPQVTFNTPVMAPDGSGLVLSATATDNVGISSLSIQANGQDILDQDPNPQVFSAVVQPEIGTINFTATALDDVQNATTVSQVVVNELTTTNTSAHQVGDKLVVDGETRATLTPAVNVVIKQCGTGIQMGTVPVDAATGKFSTAVAPSSTGDVCMDAVPVNARGQEGTQSEVHAPYTIEKPEVIFQLDPQNPGRLIVLAKTPQSLDDTTFKAWGEQPQWKQMGAVGSFTCDNLQIGNIDMGGQAWDVKLTCPLPSGDVGDATIFFDIKDNNGFSLRGSFPMQTEMKLNLRDDPSMFESAVYWGGLMTLLIAGLAGTGALGAFIAASHDNMEVAGKMKKARTQLETLLAAEQGKRWAQGYRNVYAALDEADAVVYKTSTGLRGVLRGPNRERYISERIAENDTLRIIATSEQIDESIAKVRISPDLIQPQFIPDIGDAVANLDLLYQPRPGQIQTDVRKRQLKAVKGKMKEWIDTFALNGSKFKDLSAMMTNNAKPLNGNILKLIYEMQVQKKGKYHHLWEELIRDDIRFATELQDLGICYASTTMEVVDHGAAQPALSINANSQRLLKSVRHRTIGDRELIHILHSRGLIVQVDRMLATLKAPSQKVLAALGLLDAGDIDKAVTVLAEVPDKTTGFAQTQVRIASIFVNRWQKEVYAALPPNYKCNMELIRNWVRSAFTQSNQLQQFGQYVEIIAIEIQKKNMVMR